MTPGIPQACKLSCYQENTTCRPNTSLMLGQRRRRCTNIKPVLNRRLVLARYISRANVMS